MLQQPLIEQSRAALKPKPAVGLHSVGKVLPSSAAPRDITFDPNAVQAAVGSLYETLRKCEDERMRLVNLMDDAKAVQIGRGDHSRLANDRQSNASVDQGPPASLTAQQLSQLPALDSWISRRLVELHETDRALAKRQQKLETLEGSLTRITQGLATQLHEIIKAKDELAGEQGSVQGRLIAARDQISEELQLVEHRVSDHVKRMTEAQDHVEAGLVQFEDQGKEAMTSLQNEFETMAQSVVGRLEGVRKPVDKWLKQHLAQYEVMLNECVEKAHMPMAQRIETFRDEVGQAMMPAQEQLKEQMQEMREQVKANGQQIQDAMHQQADAIHASMSQRVKLLDEEVAQLIEPMYETIAAREQAILDQAAELQEALESKAATQRMAFEKTILDQAYEAQSQIRVAVQGSRTQMGHVVKELQNDLEQQVQTWAASAQKQVQDAMHQTDMNMNQGLESIGHKSNEIEQWYASRRSEMNHQMNELEEEARTAATSAQKIMVRRISETKKQLPGTIEKLVQDAQTNIQQRIQAFQTQIETQMETQVQKAYQQAFAESHDRARYLESQTLAQFGESDQRMRQRMATLHGDARSMLDMIENQLARRVQACQANVSSIKNPSAADGSDVKKD